MASTEVRCFFVRRVGATLQIEVEATDGWMGLTVKDGTAELDRIVVPVNQTGSGEKFQARARRLIGLISPYLPTKLLTGQGEMEQSMPRTAADSTPSTQIVSTMSAVTAATTTTTAATTALTATATPPTTTTTPTASTTKKKGPGKKLERGSSSLAGIKRPRQADGADDRKQTKGKTTDGKGGGGGGGGEVVPENTGGSHIVKPLADPRTGPVPVGSTSAAVRGTGLPRPVPSVDRGTCGETIRHGSSLALGGSTGQDAYGLISSTGSASGLPVGQVEQENTQTTGPATGFPNLVDLMGLEFGPVQGVDFLGESESEKAESDRLARPVDPDRPSDGCERLVDWSSLCVGSDSTKELASESSAWRIVREKADDLLAMDDTELAGLMEEIVCGETFVGLVSRVERVSMQTGWAAG
ncbi:hypothetical protein [Phaffia rhodozyma]|uniref:Uncharacterized protein n=1 Tax=Phaffia rhodozyma TaxID=264483 RepID=A0A0F7SX71_PHARH|nr:hypothetical protein [Phaffia rhodozyma]